MKKHIGDLFNEIYEREFEKYSHRTVRNFLMLRKKTPSIKRGCPDSLVLKIKHKKMKAVCDTNLHMSK